MRTVRELRLAGWIAYVAALVLGLGISFGVHALLGGTGRLGWEGFNLQGLLEGLFFLLIFTLSLWVAKRAVRVPATTLLTAGLVAPPPARALAKPVPLLENVDAYEGRLAVVVEDGQPVGVLGLDDHVVPWDEAPVVSGEVAATELSPLFWRYPIVIVADEHGVHGAITRERYLRMLGVG
ncbi:hypothetical protein [Marinithermus hydrothermalis]|uniref:CBS domain-containing protein n=1 Tax=Marinithermus hydrothermalis (strain DSM 14884 / JCM 11576 / T1) TaxID=869210 RepID=F2NQ27_MARHT|nr:hypothetical protein [Marinithermus hydrothermalis]AEB11128.1 hypothetical protein Marky_0375 [Marinithermus hydrothermalis DSM 14884]